MIKPEQFLEFLETKDISFFTGVPDSLLQAFCIALFNKFGTSNANHIVAVNEGNAVALGAGYHLATGKTPLVYLQNSGLGNIVNPATSLTDPAVYGIPIVYIVGWRGEPGIHDEPQHVKQGKITCDLLDVLKIPYMIVDKNTTLLTIESEFLNRFDSCMENGGSVAIVVRKGAFDKPQGEFPFQQAILPREDVIKKIADKTGDKDFIIATTGKISRELFEYRKTMESPFKQHDFLTVGSMGHASTIALSVALQHKDKTVWCIDGDGAVLMHMGSLATIGTMRPSNLIHVVLNNASHESVGGMPTVAKRIDLPSIARAVGYPQALRVHNEDELTNVLDNLKTYSEGPIFIEIFVSSGSRSDLIRPNTTPEENKIAFMHALKGN